MFCRDVLQTSRPHGASAQHDLTGSRIERLQKFDDSTHRIDVKHGQIDDEFEVIE
jgi:hypothetical protein